MSASKGTRGASRAKKTSRPAKTGAAKAKKSAATRSSTTAKSKKSSKKTTTKKAGAKKTATKKTSVKKAVTKKTKKPAAKKSSRKMPAKARPAKAKAVKKATPKKASSTKAAKKTVKKVAKRAAPAKKTPAKKTQATQSSKKQTPKKSTPKKPTKRSSPLPETKSTATAKRAATSEAKRPKPKSEAAKQAAVTKAAKLAAKSRRGAAPKKRRERKAKPPAKTMSAPEPTREVLVYEEMPDVRRAISATTRRAGARGHLQPNVTDGFGDESMAHEPLDATLIMNTLAVDVQPKIEDNYDYGVLDEFTESEFCPRSTRMVNTGCGGGEAAVYFAKRGFNCVGIDPDRADVGLARERAWLATVDIDFMVGDLFETPNLLPAASFGLAVDRGAFYQIENERERQRYLGNIQRLLFRGGVLLLSAGFFPVEDAGKTRKSRAKKGNSILLASEGGVVVHEMRAAGFSLLHRVLRPTNDSGELGELLLYLRK